jgi:hypothetical protein
VVFRDGLDGTHETQDFPLGLEQELQVFGGEAAGEDGRFQIGVTVFRRADKGRSSSTMWSSRA